MSRDARLSVSKLSDIATITNFSIPPSSTRNPGIIPSDDPGEAGEASIQACKDIRDPLHRDHNAQTSQTDRQTDTDIVA